MNVPIRKAWITLPVAGTILTLLKDAEARGLKDLPKIYRASLIRLCKERLEKLAKDNG